MSAPYPLNGDLERDSVCVRFDAFPPRYLVIGTFAGSPDSEVVGHFSNRDGAIRFARAWRNVERPDGLLCIESEDGESWEVMS